MASFPTIIKQALIMLGLFLSVTLALLFVSWIQKPLYKVLIDAEDQIEFNLVIPVLENNGLNYAVDVEAAILYIETGYYLSAVQKLKEAKVNIGSFEDNTDYKPNECGWSYQEFFYEQTRMLVGLVIIIILVFGFLRPLVKKIQPKNK